MAIAISFVQLLAVRLGEESGSTGPQTLFQCVQCQGKASMSHALLCGRCFSCDATYYIPHAGESDPPLPTAQGGATTQETLIHDRLELDALGCSGRQYLEQRGFTGETIQVFAPSLYETDYKRRPCLAWHNDRHGCELREMSLTSTFKSTVAPKWITTLTLAEAPTVAVICEGFLSAMSYAQQHHLFHGTYYILNSVSTLKRFQAEYLKSFTGYQQVMLALDHDRDGLLAANRLKFDLFRYKIPFMLALPPLEDHDWNDMLPKPLPPVPSRPAIPPYVWPHDTQGQVVYDESEAELCRRRTYLASIDGYAQATYADIEALVATPGRKIACWAASVGKTTAIRQFITVHWRAGILYVARTVEEIERLAYDLTAFLGTTAVLALSASMDAYQEYVDQPELLHRYPVLLITHERLRLDPPGLLMGAPAYCNQRSARQQARTYLLIDEHPTTFRALTLTTTQHALITAVIGGAYDEHAAGTFDARLTTDRPELYAAAQHARSLLSGRTQDDRLSRYRAFDNLELLCQTIRALSHEEKVAWFSPSRRTCTYYYNIGELDYDHMVIFDGTGDLTMTASPLWEIHKDPRLRYTFRGELQQFTMEAFPMVPRSRTTDLPVPSRTLLYDQWLTQVLLPNLTGLCRKHERILLVCWKNYKDRMEQLLETDEILAHYHLDLKYPGMPNPFTLTTTETPKVQLDLGQRIQAVCTQAGLTNLDVTHYQSGETRATSKFASCDAILFLGSFYIPQHAIEEYNRVNQSTMTRWTWTLAELVQATYRTRARHGLPVTVYFTADWEPSMLTAMRQYLAMSQVVTQATFVTDGERLMALLQPDPRISDRTRALLTRYASSLVQIGCAIARIGREELGDMKPRDVLRSLNTVLGEHGQARWILPWHAHSTHGLVQIQLYVPPGLLELVR